MSEPSLILTNEFILGGYCGDCFDPDYHEGAWVGYSSFFGTEESIRAEFEEHKAEYH